LPRIDVKKLEALAEPLIRVGDDVNRDLRKLKILFFERDSKMQYYLT